MDGPWSSSHRVSLDPVDTAVSFPPVTFSFFFGGLMQKFRVHSWSFCVLLRHETRGTVRLRISGPYVGLNSVLFQLEIV